MTRNWTTVGEQYVDKRPVIEGVIERLTWEPVEGGKPMMPALALEACIKQLRLPHVSRVAIDGHIELPESPPAGSTGYYSVYGIECRYRDGAARVYVLDKGSEILPLCSDFPVNEEA